MIELETATFLAELVQTVVVDGVATEACLGPIEQKRLEESGLLIESMQMVADVAKVGQVAVGQVVDIDGVTWEADSVQRLATLQSVTFIRYLS